MPEQKGQGQRKIMNCMFQLFSGLKKTTNLGLLHVKNRKLNLMFVAM